MTSESYYAAEGQSPALQQGDIVLAPLGRFEAIPNRAGRWDALDEFTVEAPRPPSGLASYVVKSGYGLVMVTTHDCHLDREFLDAYERYRGEGMRKEEATLRAEENTDLDRFLNVSPLISLEGLRPTRDSITKNQVIGLFPVHARREVGIDESAVDLLYRATIERHAIFERIAVISEETRLALRYALARLDALRTPVIGFELEAAVGQRVSAVRKSSSNAVGVVLELGNGDELQLLLEPAPVARGGAERSGAPKTGGS